MQEKKGQEQETVRLLSHQEEAGAEGEARVGAVEEGGEREAAACEGRARHLLGWNPDPHTAPGTVIYIAGPMTRLPDLNHPAFHETAARLRRLYPQARVINPAENPQLGSWEEMMRTCLSQVCLATQVVLLDGWHSSRGARLEMHVARELRIPIYPPLYVASLK